MVRAVPVPGGASPGPAPYHTNAPVSKTLDTALKNAGPQNWAEEVVRAAV